MSLISDTISETIIRNTGKKCLLVPGMTFTAYFKNICLVNKRYLTAAPGESQKKLPRFVPHVGWLCRQVPARLGHRAALQGLATVPTVKPDISAFEFY